MGAFREGRPGRIGSDVPGDARQRVHGGTRVDVETEQGGRGVESGGGGEGKGGRPQLAGVDAKDEMMHDRVSDHGQFDDLVAVDSGLCAQLADQGVERLADDGGELDLAAGFIMMYETRLIRSSPKPIWGFILPAEASTAPVSRLHRCPAMVVEPTSNATPKTASRNPGNSATTFSSSRIATVTDQPPVRSVVWSTGRTVGSTARPVRAHCSSKAWSSLSRSPVGLDRSGSSTVT